MLKIKIVIDAGHGGNDPGAVNQNTYEKDIVLDVAHKLARLLKFYKYGTLLSRKEDQFILLPDRTQCANNYNADLFISLHTNAAANTQAHGIETFHFPTSHEGERLATAVQQNLIQITHRRDRGVKEARFFVLRNTKMPAILCELGFLSNTKEKELFEQEYYRFMLAFAIVQGIQKYKEG